MRRESGQPVEPVTLMYDGALAGSLGRVRVGKEFRSSVEFIERSAPEIVEGNEAPQATYLDANRYLVTAKVLEATTSVVVVDLGILRALRWVAPGATSSFTEGTTATFESSLGLNAWADDQPVTDRAAEMFGTNHKWHVQRIIGVPRHGGGSVEIDEASFDTVEGVFRHCLLECLLME